MKHNYLCVFLSPNYRFNLNINDFKVKKPNIRITEFLDLQTQRGALEFLRHYIYTRSLKYT